MKKKIWFIKIIGCLIGLIVKEKIPDKFLNGTTAAQRSNVLKHFAKLVAVNLLCFVTDTTDLLTVNDKNYNLLKWVFQHRDHYFPKHQEMTDKEFVKMKNTKKRNKGKKHKKVSNKSNNNSLYNTRSSKRRTRMIDSSTDDSYKTLTDEESY